MADGQLSGALPPRVYSDPRHARRARLRFPMGNTDERHRTNGVDDREAVRDRLREARSQQAAFEIDDRSFCSAPAERTATELALRAQMRRRVIQRASSGGLKRR